MSNIVNFEEYANKDKFKIKKPTVKDIIEFNSRAESYDSDRMIPIEDWNGSCWKSFFEGVSDAFSPEGIDPWDTFAYVMGKLYR